jgi:hypothetical protein
MDEEVWRKPMAVVAFASADLATKEHLDAQLAATELRLEARIEATKTDILKGMLGAMVAQTHAALGIPKGI